MATAALGRGPECTAVRAILLVHVVSFCFTLLVLLHVLQSA